ncbi:hypothetical protein [Spirosoma sp.]|uniref:hypothetical protein n=1 Tax=Spirosoma sp. TaxID=1899569 RepID=UPI003B3AB86F
MPHKVFFGSPFNDNYKWVREAVRKACSELNLELRIVDETSNPGEDINLNLNAEIEACSLAVIDISEYNPNVMYELGILYALSKPTIILAEKLTFQKLPFDIRNRLIIRYDNSSESRVKDLKVVVSTALKRLTELIDNPDARKGILAGKSLFSHLDITKANSTQLSIEDFDFNDLKDKAAKQLNLSSCKTLIITEYNGPQFKGWEIKAECFESDMIFYVDINGDIRQTRRK